MKTSNEIGKISFDFNKNEVEKIAKSGKLSNFVEQAIEVFRSSLKAELVNNVSSGSTALYVDGDRYGTGPKPRGPFIHIFDELEVLRNRIKELEGMLRFR